MSALALGTSAGAIITVAFALVCLTTVCAFRCLARLFGRDRSTKARLAYGVAALASFAGILLVAGAGFVGIAALMYSGGE